MKIPLIHERDLIVGLQKGLALIQLFTDETPRLSVPDAARLAGLTKSAARRFLLTLVHDGYAQTDGRHYWLTARTLRLGQAYVDSARLPRMLRPIVEKVATETREHVSVAVRDGDEVVHIVRSRVANVSSLSIRQGFRLPMYCTGSGRSRPKSFRTASSVSGVALRPAMRAEGSAPGVAKKIKNTVTLMPNMTKSICAMRGTMTVIMASSLQPGAGIERAAHAVTQ